MNGEDRTTKFEWSKGKWSEGWLISAGAWILGRTTSTNEYELALRSKTPHERAEHLDRAATFNLASNIGAGFFAYEMFKLNPRATSAVLFAGFGLNAFVSWASLPNRFNKGAGASAALPAATGWGPWGTPSGAEPWNHDWDREWDSYRFGRFGTLGDTGVTVLPPLPPKTRTVQPPVTYTSAPMPQPVTYTPIYMPGTASRDYDFGPGF
jgi:hypothetical protein